MKIKITALVVGFIFAIGLGVSGMTQPQKVVGFLDVFGSWDPSLIFVMIGGIVVHFITYKLIRNRETPLLTKEWHIPSKKEITPTLVIGSLLFGFGWGLGGFCPGPALTSLASFQIEPAVFVASMLAGMFVFRIFDKKIGFRK